MTGLTDVLGPGLLHHVEQEFPVLCPCTGPADPGDWQLSYLQLSQQVTHGGARPTVDLQRGLTVQGGQTSSHNNVAVTRLSLLKQYVILWEFTPAIRHPHT